MHHNNSPAAGRLGGVLTSHRKWPHISMILAAMVLVVGLVAFSSTAPPGGTSLNLLGMKVASADGGHGKGSKAATPTPAPVSDHQPDVKDAHDETEMSDTEKMSNMDGMGAEAAEDPHSDAEGAKAAKATQSSTPQSAMDMSDEHASDDSGDHEDSTSEDTESNGSEGMDMSDEHKDASADDHADNEGSGADDHEGAGSEEGGHSEYEAPSDLLRNITLGGFAGINGSVLLAAAILKKRSPKKEKGRGAASKAHNANSITSNPIKLVGPEAESPSKAVGISTGGATSDVIPAVPPVTPVTPVASVPGTIPAYTAISKGDDLS